MPTDDGLSAETPHESLRWYVKTFLRRRKDEPQYCLNCHSFAFTKYYKNGRYRRWDCDKCGWTHSVTFGGKWRALPPEGSEQEQGIIQR